MPTYCVCGMHTTIRNFTGILLVGLCLAAYSGTTRLRAQDATPPAIPATSPGLFAGTLRVDALPAASIFEPAAPVAEREQPMVDSRGGSRLVFSSLYAGLITTQALDVHSTLRALDAGHREANPVVRWTTDTPAAFVSFKAATTVGTMYLIQRVRKKHPKRAMLLLAAIDTAFALVVAHNYSVPMSAR
jgi:Domain of unknown function (DUF5658)